MATENAEVNKQTSKHTNEIMSLINQVRNLANLPCRFQVIKGTNSRKIHLAYCIERGIRKREDKDKRVNVVLKVMLLKLRSDTLSSPPTDKVTRMRYVDFFV